MNTPFRMLALISCLIVFTGQARAQEGGGGIVAVLDVAQVFEKNPTFKQRMEALTAEADQFKAKMEAEQNAIRQEAERLADFAPESNEYRQLESQLAQRTTSLQTLARQTNSDLLSREARVYMDTYTQIQQVVAGIAEKYNISLVLKFEGGAIDAANRGEVVKGVNRNVVYQKELDLTEMVIQQMGSVTSTGVPGGSP